MSKKIYIERSTADASGIVYHNDTYTNVQDALDSLLVPALSITSFTNTSGIHEYGETVTEVTLNWAINKTIDTQTLDNGIGEVTSTLRTYTHTGQTITASRTYTLSVTKGSESDSKSTTIQFSHKRYWGSYVGGTIDSTGILSLDSEFASSRLMTKSMDGNGGYLYICYPASWGTATFRVNGLQNTAWSLSVQDFTNASGYTSSFNVYRSLYVQYGTGIEVQVL